MRSQTRRARLRLLHARRVLACAAIVAESAACSSEAASQAHVKPVDPGWSDAPAASANAPIRAEERWDLEGQLRALAPVAHRARSEHFGGGREGEVLASAGAYPPQAPGGAPPSTTLIERLFEASAPAPITYFVMIKRAPGFDPAQGDWEYLVVAPSGRIEERGTLPLCARCHAEAPYDHLFGIPR